MRKSNHCMMKKIVCCLMAVLLLTLPMMAMAEPGYEAVKSFLGSLLETNGSLMVYSWTEETNLDPKTITVIINTAQKGIMVTGINQNGEQEVARWETEDLLLALIGLCGGWDNLTTLMDPDYSLLVAYLDENAETSIAIDNAEDAATLYQTALDLVNNNQ